MVLTLAVPLVCPGVDREIIALQREMALLHDRVGTLQSSLDEKLGGMMAILQRTLDKVTEGNTQNALNRQTLEQQLTHQAESAEPHFANLNATLNQMSSEFLALSENLAAVGRRLNRLEQKLVDLDSAVRTLQAPPPPPSLAQEQGQPPPGLSAEDLYQSAVRDQFAGHDELALREFADYLTYFGDTGLAAEAQLHVGEIHYYRGEQEAALEAFDVFLERYPQNLKAPDALYLKAKVLEKQGKEGSANEALNRLVRIYPNSGPADVAKAELKGKRAGPAPAPR